MIPFSQFFETCQFLRDWVKILSRKLWQSPCPSLFLYKETKDPEKQWLAQGHRAKSNENLGQSCPIKPFCQKKQCLLFVKQNNENEKCGFSSHFLKEFEPRSVYGNNIDVISLLVTHKLAMRYLEIIPEPIIVSEREPPFHYCWQTTILSRNWMYEKVFLYYKSIIGKNLQSYFGL